MSVFDNMTDDEIQAAQDRFNELCNKHCVEEFSVKSGVGLVGWQKLVWAMCGVDINHRKKSGRNANSDKLIDDVRKLYAQHTDFQRCELVYNKEKTEKSYQVASKIYDYEAHNFIADSLSEKCGKKIKPSKIRGILNNEHNKEQLEQLIQNEFKELENAAFDPDELIEDIK